MKSALDLQFPSDDLHPELANRYKQQSVNLLEYDPAKVPALEIDLDSELKCLFLVIIDPQTDLERLTELIHIVLQTIASHPGVGLLIYTSDVSLWENSELETILSQRIDDNLPVILLTESEIDYYPSLFALCQVYLSCPIPIVLDTNALKALAMNKQLIYVPNSLSNGVIPTDMAFKIEPGDGAQIAHTLNRICAGELKMGMRESLLARKNLVFYNFPSSGASGIVPILIDVLNLFGYYITPFAAEGTATRLAHEVIHQYQPFFHWTHSGIAPFFPLLQGLDTKFICMHRDPRDALISWIKDPWFRENVTPQFHLIESILDQQQMHQINAGILHRLIDGSATALTQFMTATEEWLKSDMCLVITFEEMKRDVHSIIVKILEHVGIATIPQELLIQKIHQYSFETLTKRQRGDDGEAIRSGYWLRKGISGDWKNHFDDELKQAFKHYWGHQLISWGYETDLEW